MRTLNNVITLVVYVRESYKQIKAKTADINLNYNEGKLLYGTQLNNTAILLEDNWKKNKKRKTCSRDAIPETISTLFQSKQIFKVEKNYCEEIRFYICNNIHWL